MTIRIDRETGAIFGAGFVVRPGLSPGMLKHVQPSVFERLDGPSIRIAEDTFDGYIARVYAYDHDSGIEGYNLTLHKPGDSWDNWTAEKEEGFRRVYHEILAASGIGNKESLPWGHAEVVCDAREGLHSLWVVHRARPT